MTFILTRADRRASKKMGKKYRDERKLRQALSKQPHNERLHTLRLVANTMSGPLTEHEAELSEVLLERSRQRDWYHGGLPGREVGGQLLPPRITGQDPRKLYDLKDVRLGAVFFSWDIEIARIYADLAEGPIYRVSPIGDVSVHPTEVRLLVLYDRHIQPLRTPDGRWYRDLEPRNFCAPSATVLEVLPNG